MSNLQEVYRDLEKALKAFSTETLVAEITEICAKQNRTDGDKATLAFMLSEFESRNGEAACDELKIDVGF